MTIEKLYSLTPAELEAIKDPDLVKMLEPHFRVTRPEQQPKNINKKSGTVQLSTATNNYKTQNVVSRFEKMFANRPDLFGDDE